MKIKKGMVFKWMSYLVVALVVGRVCYDLGYHSGYKDGGTYVLDGVSKIKKTK